MTQHFNDYPQKPSSLATKKTHLRPIHILPPEPDHALMRNEHTTRPTITQPDYPRRNITANSYPVAAPTAHRRALSLRKQIALGATCSLLLLTFISIVHYEQGKNKAVMSSAAASYQPTQAAVSTPPMQQTALAPAIITTQPPANKAQQPTSTAVPTQGISPSIPAQTAATPLPAQTTSQATATPASTPLTTSAYVAIARSDATKVGINPAYFVKQIQLESGFNPDAQGPAGATGIAQFMPATAKGLGIDPTDPLASLNAAAHMMANLAHQFGNDYAKALAAYNLGSESVENAEQAGGANWLAQVPVNTQNYIHEIMG